MALIRLRISEPGCEACRRAVGWVSNPAAVVAGGLKPTSCTVVPSTLSSTIMPVVGFNPPATTAAGFETHPSARLCSPPTTPIWTILLAVLLAVFLATSLHAADAAEILKQVDIFRNPLD
ncbi:MAG: hypothetical protein EHM18_17805, partial [Acidobacteria bacterium]